MNNRLDPPPPIETYSALNNLGKRMFFQLLYQHINKWNVFDYKSPNGILPIEAATNEDMIKFLAEQE